LNVNVVEENSLTNHAHRDEEEREGLRSSSDDESGNEESNERFNVLKDDLKY
jgi:hypothetical protein